MGSWFEHGDSLCISISVQYCYSCRWSCYTGHLLPSSHERRYLALKLAESLLPSLTPLEVGVVFSPGLLRCVINNVHKEGNLLSAAAKHFVRYWHVLPLHMHVCLHVSYLLYNVCVTITLWAPLRTDIHSPCSYCSWFCCCSAAFFHRWFSVVVIRSWSSGGGHPAVVGKVHVCLFNVWESDTNTACTLVQAVQHVHVRTCMLDVSQEYKRQAMKMLTLLPSVKALK